MTIKITKPSDLAKYIDHTNLKPEATQNDIKKLCEEAKQYGFCSVCVRRKYVTYAKKLLEGSKVKVCVVIGFPIETASPEECHFGNMSTEEKVKEAQKANALGTDLGADEFDMVINIDALKEGKEDYVSNDITKVKMVAPEKTLKVIIETRVLTDEQKRLACYLAKEAGADFVKTSTGYVKDREGKTLGATIEDVELMRKQVGDGFGVKASGGIGDFQKARAMIMAGANRIGCSASVSIVSKQ